jgi:branched-chain amino acid transport system permease protein
MLTALVLPPWSEFQPFIYIGLALGGVYALSGVGMVVLYRATGVVFLAFGAVGAMGALISWQLINVSHVNQWIAYLACIAFGGVLSLLYGVVFGRALAGRDPLVKAVATLGLALILLGAMDLLWPSGASEVRALPLPTDNSGFNVGNIEVTWTQVISVGVGVAIAAAAAAFLHLSKLGTAMRAMANDREITATLGVPVRRVEAAAWFGCGCLAGLAGVLLADLVALDATTLTFLVISSLAAALVAQLRSILVTFLAAMAIGLVQEMVTPIQGLVQYQYMTPFVLAAIALLWTNRKAAIGTTRQGL